MALPAQHPPEGSATITTAATAQGGASISRINRSDLPTRWPHLSDPPLTETGGKVDTSSRGSTTHNSTQYSENSPLAKILAMNQSPFNLIDGRFDLKGFILELGLMVVNLGHFTDDWHTNLVPSSVQLDQLRPLIHGSMESVYLGIDQHRIPRTDWTPTRISG